MIPNFLDQALGYNLNRVALLFRRELTRSLAEYDLSPEQWQVMRTLWDSGLPLTQRDIAQLTLKDKHSTSRMIGRLLKKGWIVKTQSEKDKRAFSIRSSEVGDRYKEEVTRKLMEHFQNKLRELQPEEVQNLMGILKKLRHILGDSPTKGPNSGQSGI